jgi:hypothetical protein
MELSGIVRAEFPKLKEVAAQQVNRETYYQAVALCLACLYTTAAQGRTSGVVSLK